VYRRRDWQRLNIRWRRCAHDFLATTFIAARRDSAVSLLRKKKTTTIIQPIRNRPRMHLQRYLVRTRPCSNLKPCSNSVLQNSPLQITPNTIAFSSVINLEAKGTSLPLFFHEVFVQREDDGNRQKNTCSTSDGAHKIGNDG